MVLKAPGVHRKSYGFRQNMQCTREAGSPGKGYTGRQVDEQASRSQGNELQDHCSNLDRHDD